jgi:hypothetical protein
MRFGTWNVRSLYKSGPRTAVARESERYKLGLVGTQELERQRGRYKNRGLNLLCGKGNKIHQFETEFFVLHRIISEVKRVAFVSDRMSCIVMRGCSRNIIV